MYDQTLRSVWLEEQLWPKLRTAFPNLVQLPQEVLITVGYPSSGARGRSEKIKPAEVNYQWHGNPNEKAFVSIHPVYFVDPKTAAKAVLFGASKFTGGARWGASHVGLKKMDDGTLVASPSTDAKLDEILADIGEPPAGFGVPFPVRTVQRARLRKYVNVVKTCTDHSAHTIIRAASDTLQVNCTVCQNAYVLA